jgi:hypothetical protein
MSWLSWLLPDSPAAQARKDIRKARRSTDAVKRPITSLVVGIVSASWQCTQEVKPHLRINSEFTKAPHTPQEQDIYIFYEFLYFFMHLMNREAHHRLPISKLDSNHSAGREPMSTLGFGRFQGERRVPWKSESLPCCAGLRKPSGDGSWNSRRSAPASASGQRRERSQASSRVFLNAGTAGASAFHC